MPEEGYPVSPKPEMLTFEEIARLVRIAAGLGIEKVRLTGGEPLVRKELPALVGEIADIPTIRDISVTTNGFLLPRMAHDLARSGLHRVNISLDTLDPVRFVEIARRGDLATVMDGIRSAQDAGLSPIKINCVLLRGMNDHEVADFAAWTLREDVHVRFIEVMPIRWNLDDTVPQFTTNRAFAAGGNTLVLERAAPAGMLSDVEMRRRYVSAAEAIDNIERAHGPLEPAEVVTNGPARTYRIPGALGTIGFISQISHDFCAACNRLRLTADGYLRPCLMADGEAPLRDPMRGGATDEELSVIFREVIRQKPERHYLAEGQQVHSRGMSQLGG